MSPIVSNEAWRNPVFREYLVVLAGLLIIAGALIALLRFVFRKNVDHAWKAYRGWLIMIPLVFAALFFGRTTTVIFFTLVSLAAFTEFARATGLYRDWGMTGVVLAGIVG